MSVLIADRGVEVLDLIAPDVGQAPAPPGLRHIFANAPFVMTDTSLALVLVSVTFQVGLDQIGEYRFPSALFGALHWDRALQLWRRESCARGFSPRRPKGPEIVQ